VDKREWWRLQLEDLAGNVRWPKRKISFLCKFQTIPPKKGPKNGEKMSNGSPPPIHSFRASSPY
jgi:hypothetical protein